MCLVAKVGTSTELIVPEGASSVTESESPAMRAVWYAKAIGNKSAALLRACVARLRGSVARSIRTLPVVLPSKLTAGRSKPCMKVKC